MEPIEIDDDSTGGDGTGWVGLNGGHCSASSGYQNRHRRLPNELLHALAAACPVNGIVYVRPQLLLLGDAFGVYLQRHCAKIKAIVGAQVEMNNKFYYGALQMLWACDDQELLKLKDASWKAKSDFQTFCTRCKDGTSKNQFTQNDHKMSKELYQELFITRVGSIALKHAKDLVSLEGALILSAMVIGPTFTVATMTGTQVYKSLKKQWNEINKNLNFENHLCGRYSHLINNLSNGLLGVCGFEKFNAFVLCSFYCEPEKYVEMIKTSASIPHPLLNTNGESNVGHTVHANSLSFQRKVAKQKTKMNCKCRGG